MIRDEMIDAGVQAMHDLFKRPGAATNREYAAAVVEAVEPLIRDDEREQYQGRRDDMMQALSEELLNVRADLRAKVEALREEKAGPFSSPMNAHMIVDDHTAGEVSSYDRVLALLEEQR